MPTKQAKPRKPRKPKKRAPQASEELSQRRRKLFLERLRICGSATNAAAAAGVKRITAYSWRERSETFKAEWDDALEQYGDLLEEEAHRRGYEGVDEPVIYKGELAGIWVDKSGKQIHPNLIELDEEGQVVAGTGVPAGARFIPLTVKKYSDRLLLAKLKAARPDKYRDRIALTGEDGGPIRGEFTLNIGPRRPTS
jgi:hypothetical protein